MSKKYRLIDMIEGRIVGEGSIKELAELIDTHAYILRWSHLQKSIVLKRYLVIEEDRR